MRQASAAGALTLPETSALARLEYASPTSSTILAKLEQISPQSIGTILAALEARAFIWREADPQDGRRIVICITTVTKAGMHALHNDRNARPEPVANALPSVLAGSNSHRYWLLPLCWNDWRRTSDGE